MVRGQSCANFRQVSLGIRREVAIAGIQRARAKAGDVSTAVMEGLTSPFTVPGPCPEYSEMLLV